MNYHGLDRGVQGRFHGLMRSRNYGLIKNTLILNLALTRRRQVVVRVTSTAGEQKNEGNGVQSAGVTSLRSALMRS